jgi:hypothetical protein
VRNLILMVVCCCKKPSENFAEWKCIKRGKKNKCLRYKCKIDKNPRWKKWRKCGGGYCTKKQYSWVDREKRIEECDRASDRKIVARTAPTTSTISDRKIVARTAPTTSTIAPTTSDIAPSKDTTEHCREAVKKKIPGYPFREIEMKLLCEDSPPGDCEDYCEKLIN